jgi:hypothetical protein
MRYAFATSNKNQNRHVNHSELHPDSFIQDTNAHAVHSNVGADYIQMTSIEDIFDLGVVSTKDATNINYQTQAIGQERNNLIHDDLELARNVPEHVARTNIGKNVYKNVSGTFSREFQKNTPLTQVSVNPGKKGDGNVSSRDHYLAPKLQAGGFSNSGVAPMRDRMQQVQEPYESEKSKVSKAVMEQFQGRFLN